MQRSLFPEQKRITEHGGSLRKGKRKSRRPIALKRPMHVVLKSDIAKGNLSLLKRRNARFIAEVLPKAAQTYGVNIYEMANAGNHLHLAIKAKDRRGFQNFLRVIGSRIAMFVTGARKGRAAGKFWTCGAYSRIVEWGLAFRTLCAYVIGNVAPARAQTRAGVFVPYKLISSSRRRNNCRRTGTACNCSSARNSSGRSYCPTASTGRPSSTRSC